MGKSFHLLPNEVLSFHPNRPFTCRHPQAKRLEEELYNMRKDPDQLINLAHDSVFVDELKRHRETLKIREKKIDDKGQYPASKKELGAVYKGAKGKDRPILNTTF
jgi:hypothetical protein